MTKYYHTTNNSNSNAPSTSDIDVGEVSINSSSLGNITSGVQSGRLYIKLSNGEIRRFISLGLSSSSDPSLKTKYGGTNNVFSGVSANTDSGSDSLMIFKFNSPGNHTIDKTPSNKLTWNNTFNGGAGCLAINKAGAGSATLHVGGDVKIDTVSNWSDSTFNNSTFKIVGHSTVDNELYGIPSLSFFSYVPDSTIAPSKISGTIPVNRGGAGFDHTSNSPTNGSILFYNTSGPKFDINSNLRIDSANNKLVIVGSIEHNAAVDSTNNATPLGVDNTNKIVKLSSATVTPTSKGGTGADLTQSPVDGGVVFYRYVYNNSTFQYDHYMDIDTNIEWDASAQRLDIQAGSSEPGIKITPYSYGGEALEIVNQGIIKYNPATATSAGTICVDSNGELKIDVSSVSSQRFKENIQSYNKGLNEVLNLNPVTYSYISDSSHKMYGGLIAEQVAEQGLEEFVIRDNNGQIHSVQYGQMIALLINAIKTLKVEIDSLKTHK